MRVLQLLASTGFYGAEGVVSQLFHPLTEQGCHLTLGLLHASRLPRHGLVEHARACGIDVVDVPCDGRLDLSTVAALRRCIREREIELIHTHSYKANFYGLFAARSSGIPILATCHNWTERTAALKLYSALDKCLLRRFDRVVAVSDSISTTLIQSGFPPARVCTIRNGIDTHRFADASEGALEGAGGTSRGRVILGTLSRLSKEKGIDVLVRALAELRASWPDLLCMVAGDGPERAAILNLAAELGVSENLLLAGFCSDVPAFLRACAVIVHPSRMEAMPLAILEAMAAGKPIVATAVGGIPSLIEDGVSGVLTRADDAHALAEGIRRMLNDLSLRRSAGVAARRYATAHCDVRATAARYVEQYAHISGARARVPVPAA